jgi:hypothetical protein
MHGTHFIFWRHSPIVPGEPLAEEARWRLRKRFGCELAAARARFCVARAEASFGQWEMGILFGAVAVWRRNLRANMMAHALTDIWAGWLSALVLR